MAHIPHRGGNAGPARWCRITAAFVGSAMTRPFTSGIFLLCACCSHLPPRADSVQARPPGPVPTAERPAPPYLNENARRAALALGPVPGYAGEMLEGCTYVVLLTDTLRHAAAARKYFAGELQDARAASNQSSGRSAMTLLNSMTGTWVPSRLSGVSKALCHHRSSFSTIASRWASGPKRLLVFSSSSIAYPFRRKPCRPYLGCTPVSAQEDLPWW